MMQIVEQTDEEKMAMYMKVSKKKLCEMLIQCNKIIDARPPEIILYGKSAWEIENEKWGRAFRGELSHS